MIAITTYGYDEWNLDKTGESIARRIAKQLRLSIEEFLTRLSGRQFALPLAAINDIENHSEPPKGFRVARCDDSTLWGRVERAAKADGVSVEMFVWSAIGSMVSCSEEDMIIHPETGEALGHVQKLEDYRRRHCVEDGGPEQTSLA